MVEDELVHDVGSLPVQKVASILDDSDRHIVGKPCRSYLGDLDADASVSTPVQVQAWLGRHLSSRRLEIVDGGVRPRNGKDCTPGRPIEPGLPLTFGVLVPGRRPGMAED